MNEQNKIILSGILFFVLIFIFQPVHAQFELNGQLISRTEYRNGFGKVLPDSLSPAIFIGQRTRLQAQYRSGNLKFFASIQDIRTWGNTSQVKSSDDFLSMHEGWAQLNIDSAWSIKAGRQELNYDNARFLGNLDWALQARAHDFLLIKFEKGKHKLHAGGGYNQAAELMNNTAYTVSNQYKTAQMLWYNFKTAQGEISVMAWNDGKEMITRDTTGKITSHKTKFSQTFGLPVLLYRIRENAVLSGFAYYQTGKDISDQNIQAYDVSAQCSYVYLLNQLKNRKLKFTAGTELLSGTTGNSTLKTNRSFNPMYGTNHMHNGYMDHFYVGGRFENSVGLNDFFFRFRYDASKKWFTSVDVHDFYTNASLYNSSGSKVNNHLGTEIDLTTGITFSADVSLQLGYSQFLTTSALGMAEKVTKTGAIQNWGYLMLIVRPHNDKKYIGVLN